jgi:hypothetical protein
MGLGVTFRLEQRDGRPADPPTLETAELNWKAGDPIFLGPGRTLRVVETRPAAERDGEAVLVVEPD